jgi:hypothetical protein
MFPGDTVTIKVRALDLQSGVNFVRVQFKDPDSAEQDAEGLEHRLYQLFQFDIFFPNRILVEQGQAYVPLFVEVGQQAIHPQTYEYKEPYSLARLGFDGRIDDTLLLQPELDDNGNPTDWYVATWRTPDIPSDFYLDVIVRDNAGNEFIYDNISGFTTQQFTGAHNILLVSDYMGGQIFVQNRVDVIGNSITRPTWQPVESYWTDNPTGKPPFDITQPPSGQGTIIHGDGAIVHPTLGLPSFSSAPTRWGRTPPTATCIASGACSAATRLRLPCWRATSRARSASRPTLLAASATSCTRLEWSSGAAPTQAMCGQALDTS